MPLAFEHEHLADRPNPGALGDDRVVGIRSGCGLEQRLAADREADSADLVRVHVGPALQERRRGLEVLVELPAEDVRGAVARGLAATVEDERAVAVAHEHPRLPLRAAAAREDDDGCAVLRRDVPAVQLETVARLERDVLVGGSELGRRHHRARRVREDVGDGHRHHEHVEDDEPARGEQDPPPVPANVAVIGAPRPPERHGAQADENDAGGQRQETGVVVARRADLERVVDGLACSDRDPEHPDRKRERGARSGSEAWVEPCEGKQRRQR